MLREGTRSPRNKWMLNRMSNFPQFLFVLTRLELTMGSPRTPGDCMLTIVNTSVKLFFQNSLPSFPRMVVKSLSSQRDISAPINSLPSALPLTSNCGSRGSFDIFGSVPRLVPRSRREWLRGDRADRQSSAVPGGHGVGWVALAG